MTGKTIAPFFEREITLTYGVFALWIFFAMSLGAFTSYLLLRHIREKTLAISIIGALWLVFVTISFFFGKEIPGYFDVLAPILIAFQTGMGVEMIREFILNFGKGKKQ